MITYHCRGEVCFEVGRISVKIDERPPAKPLELVKFPSLDMPVIKNTGFSDVLCGSMLFLFCCFCGINPPFIKKMFSQYFLNENFTK